MSGTGTRALQRYSAYGLSIDSAIALPGLLLTDRPADIRVRLGSVPRGLDAPLVRGVSYEATDRLFLLNLDRIARYLVADGKTVTVEPVIGGDGDAVHLFLLNSALDQLLAQRGSLVLHAAACVTRHGAVLLAGHSGEGKSTLLAALVKRGCPMIADDLAAISAGASSGFVVQPGIPLVRLWSDAATRMGLATDTLARVRPSLAKYLLPVARSIATEQPVTAVYVLEFDGGREIEASVMKGQQRLALLRMLVRPRRVVEGTGLHLRLFPLAAAFAAAVPVIRVRRPRDPLLIDELAARIDVGE